MGRCPCRIYWGWVVCVCFLLLFTLTAGVAFSFSETMIPLNKEVHTSITLLSWMGSMPVSLPMLAAPIGTYLHYHLGCQRTVFLGVFITTLGLALTSLVTSVALMFLTYGLVVGFGMMCIVNPPFFLLDEYFPYHHPRHVLATSVIACGFPLATLIFNPLTYAILEKAGWRITYSIFAVAVFVVGITTSLTFRGHGKGQAEDEIVIISPSEEDNVERQKYEELEDPPIPLAKRTKLILGGIWLTASVLKSMGYYTPFVTLVKQLDVLGIPQSQSSKAMAVIGTCEVVSRVVTSYVGDYFKGKILYVYVVCTLALCLQNALGSLATQFTELLVYAAALGIFGGPIIAAMYSSCSEVMLGQNVPALFSCFRVGLGLGSLIGPTIAGAIFDHTSSFHIVFYVNAAVYLSCSLLYAVIIILNRYQPRWCFPDLPEQIALTTSTDKPVDHKTFTSDTNKNCIADTDNTKAAKEGTKISNGEMVNPLYKYEVDGAGESDEDMFTLQEY